MLTAIEEHLQPLWTEADDEILSVGHYGHANAAGKLAPLPELKDVPGDICFLELATVFPEPILDQVAVGSSRRSVNLDLGHAGPSALGVGAGH